MNSVLSSKSIRILYIPPYYENHFELALNRLIPHDKHIEYQVFTVDKKYITVDLNSLLSMCRTIINEEHIQMLISDSQIGQLIVAKLCQEYPQIHNGGMNFLNTFQCINRFLMIELFGTDECIPTLLVDITEDWKTNYKIVQTFTSYNNDIDGYVKSLYGFDNQLSSFHFTNREKYTGIIHTYVELYKQQHQTNLLPLYRVYIPVKQYPFSYKPSYLVQKCFNLVKYPHWRLVIASACIFDKEILMWPLVDGYSGWPFLAEKPLAILPIIVCPSRQISNEQQGLIYTRFRKHLNHLITNHHLCYGWIECSYFISCTNEIRLISIKPTYSVYLTEAFNSTSQHGNPIQALVNLSYRQRPKTPILNGKTVYMHRLWMMNNPEKTCIKDLINMTEVNRIHRSNICMNRYVRLRFQDDDIIDNNNTQISTEIGFIQVNGEYHEIGLANLIEFRSILLKKPQLFPFTHHSTFANNPYQFDPIKCLPSNELLEQLEKFRREEEKDLI